MDRRKNANKFRDKRTSTKTVGDTVKKEKSVASAMGRRLHLLGKKALRGVRPRKTPQFLCKPEKENTQSDDTES